MQACGSGRRRTRNDGSESPKEEGEAPAQGRNVRHGTTERAASLPGRPLRRLHRHCTIRPRRPYGRRRARPPRSMSFPPRRELGCRRCDERAGRTRHSRVGGNPRRRPKNVVRVRAFRTAGRILRDAARHPRGDGPLGRETSRAEPQRRGGAQGRGANGRPVVSGGVPSWLGIPLERAAFHFRAGGNRSPVRAAHAWGRRSTGAPRAGRRAGGIHVRPVGPFSCSSWIPACAGTTRCAACGTRPMGRAGRMGLVSPS